MPMAHPPGEEPVRDGRSLYKAGMSYDAFLAGAGEHRPRWEARAARVGPIPPEDAGFFRQAAARYGGTLRALVVTEAW